LRTALAVRHVHFEDLGILGPILAAVDSTAPDLLVVLGVPICAYEENLYPFLERGRRVLEEWLGNLEL